MPIGHHIAFHRLIPTVLSLLFLAYPPFASGQQRTRVGQTYPDFLLPRIDNGKAVSLSQFRGKKVLLIHFASW